jgi:hypothetical protein
VRYEDEWQGSETMVLQPVSIRRKDLASKLFGTKKGKSCFGIELTESIRRFSKAYCQTKGGIRSGYGLE